MIDNEVLKISRIYQTFQKTKKTQKNAWFIKINEVLLRSQPEKRIYQIKKEKK